LFWYFHYFHFSIFLLKINFYRLVVGAPESESTNPNLRGIRRPGAVYVCSVNKPTCREIHVDKKQGNERRLNGSVLAPIENKAHQFFGATVKSNNKHDKIIMCAPKYKYFFSKFEVIEPVGSCFFAENGFTDTQEFAPCRQEREYFISLIDYLSKQTLNLTMIISIFSRTPRSA
uniref:Integrin alpha pat-2 (inferred by orthology to a C. elegans protein) n=1 Tax=Nippostrongylus brasiliensis TaxID=27835 RepID=A0A0N4XEN7_NIPBR